jgi:sensor histidine kinase YesM
MKQTQNSHTLQLFIHITGWGLFFAFPFLVFWRYPDFNIVDGIIHHSETVLPLMTIFYLNYFVLTEKFLFHRKTGKFLLYNILSILFIGIVIRFWQRNAMPPMPFNPRFQNGNIFQEIPFILWNALSLFTAAVLGVTIRMTGKWYKTETERQREQNERTEAELKNLRQQLNPHFLFNTLNNIYAQIAISPEKAQESMLELSKLLRYVLYENNGNFVPLERELNFIHNYVELMRIRLNPEVDMRMNINIVDKDKLIAPLMFIALLENAFKHGISPTQQSFIDIYIYQNKEKQLNCTIKNSYFPKDQTDQSGSGIGMENLRRRLEILYPNKYVFRAEKVGNEFVAELILPLLNRNEL